MDIATRDHSRGAHSSDPSRHISILRHSIPTSGRSASRLVRTQRLLPLKGQVLALPYVRSGEAKYSVVRTERIFDGVVAFIHWSGPPKVGAIGNGHHENLSAFQPEMGGGIVRAGAIRAAAKRILRLSVATFGDACQSVRAVTKPERERDLVLV
jgi:hypothetical protein